MASTETIDHAAERHTPAEPAFSAQRQSQPPKTGEKIKRTLIAAGLFVVALAASVISPLFVGLSTEIKEFFLALTAAMAVHLLDRLWLFKDTSEALDGVRNKIISNVAEDTKKLISNLERSTTGALVDVSTSIQKSITSFQAMSRAGVVRIYENREEACDDIARDLVHTTNRKIRMIGISLNDFVLVLTGNPRLSAAWNHIRNVVEHGAGDNQTLDVKILIIDPTSLGAQLRSRGEERMSNATAGRLKHDVDVVVDELLKMEENCKQLGVSFACRLYRISPVLSLYMTDTVSYVQQYYFWSARVNNKSFPILKFQNLQNADGNRSIHEELEMHFDWIWEKASVPLHAYRNEYALGVDKGITQVGIVNVYTEPMEGLMRMRHLLSHATERVSVQGISLHSFFDRRGNPALYRILRRLVVEEKVRIEVLFLNPDSEQAKFRGFREKLFDVPDFPREEYFNDNHKVHSGSTLHAETLAAVDELKLMIKDIAKQKPANWKPNVTAGFYDSAPHCFLLRVDGSMLSEQYHYGKLREDDYAARVILGKDLPLVEFVREPSDLFEKSDQVGFALLDSHFEFAMQQAELIDLS